MPRKKQGAHPRDALTAARVGKEKRPGLYCDGNGLYLRVDPSGARRWVLRTVIQGKRRNIGLGSARLVSLKDAREQARTMREIARDHGDPIMERRIERAKQASAAVTFEEMAHELFETKKAEWRNEKHRAQWIGTLAADVFPVIGKLPVNVIGTDDVLKVLTPIWTVKPETASRTRMRIEAVLDSASARGLRSGDNPARWKGHLDHLLAKPGKVHPVEHYPALDWRKVPDFMRDLASRDGVAAKALAFAILTVARSGAARNMTWAEIDLKDGVWTVPGGAEGRKAEAGLDHRVPLTPAALALLGEPGKAEELVFPSRKKNSPLTDKALTKVLDRMPGGRPLDVEGKPVTVHGFRSSFRDWAGETSAHPREVVEAAMGHRLKDKAEAAYARGDLFLKRRALMSDWADFATGQKGRVRVLKEAAQA